MEMGTGGQVRGGSAVRARRCAPPPRRLLSQAHTLHPDPHTLNPKPFTRLPPQLQLGPFVWWLQGYLAHKKLRPP